MVKLRHPLDNIVYEKQKSPKKIHEYVTLDWENIILAPLSNSSQQTQDELDYVFKAAMQRDEKNMVELVKQIDTKTWSIFDEFLALHAPYSDRKKLEKMTEKTWDIVWKVVLNLKRKFNRPRPYQLRSDINVMTTKTHDTPAYPSGHASYGYSAAKVVSLVYPELKDGVEKVANTVAFARVLQGVHYPSDGAASKVLMDKLWEDIGFKMFPEYYSAATWIEKKWRNV